MGTTVIEQLSKDWFASRGGMLSASMVHRIMGGTVGADTVRSEIRQWRKTGVVPESFASASTEWGQQHEAQARASASMETGIDFEPCGSFIHPMHVYMSASPDGIGPAMCAGLEIKCPHNPRQHERYQSARNIPPAYRWQMQAGMWCTGIEKWLFVSFDPRLLQAGQPGHTILHWVPRNEALIEKLEKRVTWFWSTL